MNINIVTRDAITVVAISGAVDGKTAPEAQEQILPLLKSQGGKNKLILDMRDVTYMSSAGLRMLLLLHRQCASEASLLALVGVQPEVHDVMKVTGFLRFFMFFDSMEAAEAAFRQ